MKIETRYLSGRQADTGAVLFGRSMEVPVCFYVEGRTDDCDENKKQAAFRKAGIVLIPPYEDMERIEAELQRAAKEHVLAAGIALDLLFDEKGNYCKTAGGIMGPKTEEDLRRLQGCAERAGIPFLVKGILSQRDAYQCMTAGVSGIILSRPAWLKEKSVSPLEILPEILKVTAGEIPVLAELEKDDASDTFAVSDAFAALALGADAVCRSILPGENPEQILSSMRDGLRCLMSAAGCPDLSHRDSTVIWKSQQADG